MVPPKKDVFADLFQSASGSPNRRGQMLNLSLMEARKLQKKVQSPASDSLSGLESLNVSRSGTSSPSLAFNDQVNLQAKKTVTSNDPFSVFDDILSPTASTPSSQSRVQKQELLPAKKATSEGLSLLDDDFIDAFPEDENNNIESVPNVPLDDNEEPVDSFAKDYEKVKEKEVNSASVESNLNSLEQQDETLAQLIDIGFSMDDAVAAVEEKGNDLQSCVNYIMNKNQRPKERPRLDVPTHTEGEGFDIGDRLGSMSLDFFSKASVLLNKSKDTVIKNFEQFQSQYGSSEDIPEWMKTNTFYKEKATENRDNRNHSEYGTDEENINHDAIKSFMNSQKAKDREKYQARLRAMKDSTRERVFGNREEYTGDSAESLNSHVLSTQFSVSSEATQNRLQNSEQSSTKEAAEDDVDLLGISSDRRQNDTFDGPGKNGSLDSSQYKFISTPLNEFMESDYNTAKLKASEYFANGDYDNAIVQYKKCLASLPDLHELRVVIDSNLAVTCMKIGDYKQAKEHCDDGLELLSRDILWDNEYLINGKTLKSWYTKLLSRKAESLEMLESFRAALDCYKELIGLGISDKKTMDAKRRISNIVDPPSSDSGRSSRASQRRTTSANTAPKKSYATPQRMSSPSKAAEGENLARLKKQEEMESKESALKDVLRESIEQRLFLWSNGKEDNIRTLLTTLPDILPERLGFPFLTSKKITLGDLMLTKKVKITYMKVISYIHPDKIGNLPLEDRLLCESVFVTLNKSWDTFKVQNGLN